MLLAACHPLYCYLVATLANMMCRQARCREELPADLGPEASQVTRITNRLIEQLCRVDALCVANPGV